MPVHDVLGNHFKQGQIVLTRVGTETMLAQVVELSEGGLIGMDKGQPMQMPGRLVLQIILPMEVDSRRPVQGVWVLPQPKDEKAMVTH